MGEPVEKVACPDCGKEMFELWNYNDNTLRGWYCKDCLEATPERFKGWIPNPKAHHETMKKYGYKPDA